MKSLNAIVLLYTVFLSVGASAKGAECYFIPYLTADKCNIIAYVSNAMVHSGKITSQDLEQRLLEMALLDDPRQTEKLGNKPVLDSEKRLISHGPFDSNQRRRLKIASTYATRKGFSKPDDIFLDWVTFLTSLDPYSKVVYPSSGTSGSVPNNFSLGGPNASQPRDIHITKTEIPQFVGSPQRCNEVMRVDMSHPAAIAGLLQGMCIIGVNGISVELLEPPLVLAKMSEIKPREYVSLTVADYHWDDNFPVQSAERTIIYEQKPNRYPDVSGQWIDKDKGIYRLIYRTFNNLTEGVVIHRTRAFIRDAMGEQPIQGLVIVLRGNPGGYIYNVRHIAGLLLGINNQELYREVSYITGRSHLEKHRESTDLTNGAPILFVVDKFTVSAAELFVVALRDLGRRTRVWGEITFGKGVMQDEFVVHVKPSGSRGGIVVSVIFTSGEYRGLRGTKVDGKGVVPDRVIDFNQVPDSLLMRMVVAELSD